MKELRKLVRQTIMEYITPAALKSVENYADDLFSDVGVDVEFTRHFLDRVNDLRNKEDITPEELKNVYLKAYNKYANTISKLHSGDERVLTDPQSNINIPFAMNWDGRSPDVDLVNKTVMRKKDFKSYTPKLRLEHFSQKELDEEISSSEAHRDESALQTVIDGKRDLGFITLKYSTMPEEVFWEEIKKHGLKTISVPSNPANAFIYFRKGAEKSANELLGIANKYGGYLSYEADRDETKRIGQLLGYKESDIQDYIDLNYPNEPHKKVAEDINVPINIGDTVLGGKFKNKKIVVKDIDKNEKGDITINDKPLLRVRPIKK